MRNRCSFALLPILFVALSCLFGVSTAQAQGTRQSIPEAPINATDGDHVRERDAWFYRGRIVAGKLSAELRRRAYHAKMQMRAQRASRAANIAAAAAASSTGWTPLGPVPLASDASGTGVQDYHQVAGRATTVVIDPADPTGNTVYVGGAQAGVWKSTNAASNAASSVNWTPISDNQATLSVGSIAIQPGNADPAKTLLLVGTGEANNSADSYFGLGILRSSDAGNTWTLISTANSGALSFSGLGVTRMAFSTASTVVAAIGTISEGLVDGAVTSNTARGLYTSVDAGLSWTYNALLDGSQPTDATSATSVVYDAGAGLFFAAVRYHGLYSSPDGKHWTRVANQPGGSVLSTTACPPQSTSNNRTCPIYRGEITVVPGRNEMYTWYISLDSLGNPVDGGIWQSLDGGASWASIDDNSIINCGDVIGCGVEQGYYNLELQAVPNGSATDLYAGAVNLYKCSISTINPNCTTSGFMNLTHVYGCTPIAAPSHVHPDQHALAYMIPTSGGDSGNALMYFANDGGVYRALDGVNGLNSGSCSSINQFDDLNQNLGSMTQFVSFSQHPSDSKTLLGGAQDNGSPATSSATTSTSWVNVNGGDGGFNAVDQGAPLSWYVSNPDVAPGGLNILQCPSGVSCREGDFSAVVDSNRLGGDDGAFYFPYILDPQSRAALLIGTCRVWRGPRLGGSYTDLSPNFDTFGAGACAGSEVNLVRALAAGGPIDSNGSQVIYATTDGLGPLNTTSPTGGHVWVTTNATAGTPAFTEVSQNINPGQFPVSSVAIDTSDATGGTAYVTIMGFTNGTGHVWKTTDAGATWTDFTASGTDGTLFDAPVNAVVVDSAAGNVYVGTDVGVFQSGTAAANWIEVGPNSTGGQSGFLPNVAVTALGIFSSGNQKLLRASTYGRGIWQWSLAPDFQVTISDSPQTVVLGRTATFHGTVTAVNGYTSSIALSCVTSPPSTCVPSPAVLTATTNTAFTVTAGGAIGDYNFNVQAAGSDTKTTTHLVPVLLHVITNKPDFVLGEPTSFPTVNAGSTTTNGPISITVLNGFTGIVSLTCSLTSGNGSCSVSPASVSAYPATASVTVNATNLSAGSYQLSVQGTSGSLTHTLAVPFNVADYQLSGDLALTIAPGAQGATSLTLTPSAFYSGNINATCDATVLPGATCVLNLSNPISVMSGSAVPFTATITVPSNAASGTYNMRLSTRDTSGSPAHNPTLAVTVNPDFALTSLTTSQTVAAGQTTGTYNLTLQPLGASFNSAVTLSCPSGLPAEAHCNFNPNPATPGTTTTSVGMTISTGSGTSPGSYSVTVTGTSGSLSHSVTVALVVGGTSTFQLAISQAFPTTVDAGSQVTAKLILTPSYTGTINVTCDAGAFSGQCSVTPANPVTIKAGVSLTLTLTVNVPSSAAPNPSNVYNINLSVADSSGQPSQKFVAPLTVIQDFSVNSATPSQTATSGQTSGAYQLTIAPNPVGSTFPGAVTLSCSAGLPAGAHCLFSPSAPVTPGTVAQSVVMNISTAAATGNLTWPAGHRWSFYALWLILPGIVLAWGGAQARLLRRQRIACTLTVLVLIALTLASCGGGTGASGGGGHPGIPISYTVTVSGLSGTLAARSTSVILIVQ
jgi:hypothetical protein